MNHIFITDSDFANTDSSFQYLLWFQPSLWAMILSETELTILLDGRYFPKTSSIDISHIQQVLGISDVQVRFVEVRDLETGIIWALSGNSEILLENNIAIKYLQTLQVAFPDGNFSFHSGYFTEKRSRKTAQEKVYMKKAIHIIDEVYLFIESQAQSGELYGKTELYVRSLIIQKILELWGEGESFSSIVAFWANSAVPHHISWETLIENGPLLIDMGAKYRGYCSDFTRTIWVWKTTESFEKFQKVYEIVLHAHQEAIAQFQPDMTGQDLDIIARDSIAQSGYGQYFVHNLWHSLGMDIHEDPRLKKWDTTVLKEDIVFTIEPGIYIPWEFGIRLEDIVFLEEGSLNKYTTIKL